MLFFDQLKKNDSQLRLLAVMLTAGLLILLVGLWYVQVVSGRTFESHLEIQSYRTVRISAVRGKILDDTGTNVLAENRPRYNLCLYLDLLRPEFERVFSALRKQTLAAQKDRLSAYEKRLGRSLTKAERKQLAITTEEWEKLGEQARFQVAQEVVGEVSERMGQPIVLDPLQFERAYATRLAMPFSVLSDLTPEQIARFEENYTNRWAGLDLQSEREYPFGDTAAHVLGSVKRDDSSTEGEDAFFSYRLPDYSGIAGIEGKYNDWLRGSAGAESVLVNNLGYRQSENVWQQPEPGHSVVLTVDLDIQRAAEASMLQHQGANARGAVVVMDVRNGDVLAMVSSPAINPDYSQNNPGRMSDPLLRPEINRALQENLAPGSIFKTVVAIAALENGLNPNEIYHVEPNPERPDHGLYRLPNGHKIRDEAPPGDYNFKKAFIHSSNSYFVHYGLRAGAENIVRVGREFHLGERTGLFAGQETRGNFPTIEQVQDSSWRDGDTANLSIGQGDIDVTPMQMAVMVSAIANGGYVLWPRLVQRIEPMNAADGEVTTNFPGGQVRDRVSIHPRNLNLLREAMLADVEDKGQGTGTQAAVPGITICGKTGTAQVQDSAGREIGRNLWFASYAPFENPRYAVVVMVQSSGGGFGGTVCAPIAHDIYEAILKKETPPRLRVLAAGMRP
jgi:penicillin-binding protein 2